MNRRRFRSAHWSQVRGPPPVATLAARTHHHEETTRHDHSTQRRGPSARARPTPTRRSRPSTAPCGRWATTRPSPRDVIPALGPGARRGRPASPRATGCSTSPPARGNAAIPAARRAPTSSRTRPDARAARRRARAGAAARASTSPGRRATPRRCPTPTPRSTRVLSCVGVMFAPAPPGGGRRAGPGLPPGWPHRPDQLDPRGVHRPDVRDDEALRARRRRPGAQPPPLWGDEDHVRGLLGDRVDRRRRTRAAAAGRPLRDGAEFRDYFKARYGPTIAVYRAIADDPDRVAALDARAGRPRRPRTRTAAVMDWEYLLAHRPPALTGPRGCRAARPSGPRHPRWSPQPAAPRASPGRVGAEPTVWRHDDGPGHVRRPGHPAVAVSPSSSSTSRPPAAAPPSCGITEIGAVKVRGGEVLGEFQTLVNPGAADPAVHRGAHRHHRLDGRRRPAHRRRRCRRSSSSPRGAVLVAHNAPFDIGFLKARRARSRARRGPASTVLDTVTPGPPARHPRRGAQLQAVARWPRSSAPRPPPTTGPCTTPGPPSTSCTA